MTEKKLSQNLKELRLSLRLSQPEMGKRLGIGEKMYQLYESGKYDVVKTETVKRKKLLDKIEELKNAAGNIQMKVAAPSDLEKEIERLQNALGDKIKLLDMALKVINLQEQELRVYRRAQAHSVKKNRDN